jgi:hypothetical protein
MKRSKVSALILCILLICSLSFISRSQQTAADGLTIKANLNGLPGGKWIYYGVSRTMSQKHDSVCSFKNGFLIHIPLKQGEGEQYSINIAHADPNNRSGNWNGYVDVGVLNMTSSIGDFTTSKLKMSGSPWAVEQQNMNESLKIDSLLNTGSMMQIIRPVMMNMKAWMLAHPNSKVSPMIVEELKLTTFFTGMSCPNDSVKYYLSRMSPEAKDNMPAKRLIIAMGGK